jgi:hypothetical protein
MGMTPVEHGQYPLAQTARCLGHLEPNREQCSDHRRGINLVNREIAQLREGKLLKSTEPLCLVFGIFPASFTLRMDQHRGIPE